MVWENLSSLTSEILSGVFYLSNMSQGLKFQVKITVISDREALPKCPLASIIAISSKSQYAT